MIFVTKFDGKRQPFSKEKVIRTCLRMHATAEQADYIADTIEKEVYNGISTKEILQKIFRYLQEYKPEIRHQIDLREAIALLRPMPDFEHFIFLLLKEYGYKMEPNKFISGRCVEHEIDAVARKDNETIMVEVKHHFQAHTYTCLSTFLEVQAAFEDLVEGYRWKKHNINFNKLLIVCNTKTSDHAKKYATCRGIINIGWKLPEDKGLEQMIDEKKFYPITMLKDLDSVTQEKLGDKGIILLKQLMENSVSELSKKTKVDRQKLEKLAKKARDILY